MDDQQVIVAIAAELPPPPEKKRKDKKWRQHPRPGALSKRGPPRPHRRLTEEVLSGRIRKLTARLEHAREQVPPHLKRPTPPDRQLAWSTPPQSMADPTSSRSTRMHAHCSRSTPTRRSTA
jgi:hypothetical protein